MKLPRQRLYSEITMSDFILAQRYYSELDPEQREYTGFLNKARVGLRKVFGSKTSAIRAAEEVKNKQLKLDKVKLKNKYKADLKDLGNNKKKEVLKNESPVKKDNYNSNGSYSTETEKKKNKWVVPTAIGAGIATAGGVGGYLGYKKGNNNS